MSENTDLYGRPEFRSPQPDPSRTSQPTSYPRPYPGAAYPPPEQPYRPTVTRRRTGRGALLTVLATVSVLSLAIGGGAGYVGARLAQPDAAAPSSSGTTGPTAPAPAVTSAPPVTSSVPPAKGAADTVRIAQQVLPSTVTIRVTASGGTALGSGFVIDGDGRIMTNNHVIAGSSGSIWVTNAAGHRAKASVLGSSPSYDLAVIQVDDTSGLRPAELGDSSATRVGEAAVAIGSPLGLGGTVTEGIISAVNRPVAVGDANSADGPAYLNALQTDAPINHGNSGGPLVDGSGKVIGVNSAILTGSGGSSSDESGNIGIGFAIPINQARQIGALLIKHGYATYPVINATVSSDGSGDGVLLSDVTPGGAAADAGLQPEDLVLSVDGKPVAETDDLIVAIRNHRPGDTVTLRYERDGSLHTARVRLASKRG